MTLKSIGPGLLWAGAAIGVSHLVQSTRAGASYGFALVWAVAIANLFKYPFFEYGPRYAAATGESLLEGYNRLGRWVLILFIALTVGVMFSIQAAVTIVTAAIAANLFGSFVSLLNWSVLLWTLCVGLLAVGRYPLLDKSIKLIIVLLALSTVGAVIAAVMKVSATGMSAPPVEVPAVWDLAGISFLVALMGWMPSAFDIAVWNSLWTIERSRQTKHKPSVREALIDFNIGYLGTAFLALCFLTLGALTMFGSGESFSGSGVVFAGQFITMFTNLLGSWAKPIILIAAFTTMFSTTLTVTDGFPRVLQRCTSLLAQSSIGDRPWLYWMWMVVVIIGAYSLLSTLKGGMTFMVDLATTISFVTAPVLAVVNFKLVTSRHMPANAMPKPWLRALSWMGIIFLTGFSVLFLMWRFVL